MILWEILFKIFYYLLYFYMLCLVFSGVLSLVGANPHNPIVGFLNVLTSPPCRYLTKKFPKPIFYGPDFLTFDPNFCGSYQKIFGVFNCLNCLTQIGS